MYKYVILSICFLATNVSAQHIDIELLQKDNLQQSQNYFYKHIYQNPARMKGFGNFSKTAFKLNYYYNDTPTRLIQKPDNEHYYSININSFKILDSIKTVWGKASYANYLQKNIIWNETSDYNITYPYFTADSIGGNLNSEAYHFLGGYTKSINKNVDWGILMAYQATLSYRKKDPRCKNISSNLNLKTGVSFKISNRLNMGVNTSLTKYKQTNNIYFFSELGSPAIYHLNGLGNYNKIFKGSNKNPYYDGLMYGGEIQLLQPQDKNILSILFNQSNIDKFIGKNIKIKASRLNNRILKTIFSKKFKVCKSTHHMKIEYINDKKKGIEPILSNKSDTNINILATNEKFNLQKNTYSFFYLYQPKLKKGSTFTEPYIQYKTYHESYTLPKSFQTFRSLDWGLRNNYTLLINNTLLSLTPSIKYHTVLQSKAHFHKKNNELSIQNMLLHNYNILQNNYFNTKIDTNLKTQICKNYTIEIEATSDIIFINHDFNHNILFSLGVIF